MVRTDSTNSSIASNVVPSVNATTAMSTTSPQQWLFDSGASHHIVSNPSSLQGYTDYGGPDEIQLGDGKLLPVTHTGYTALIPYRKNSIPLISIEYNTYIDRLQLRMRKIWNTNYSYTNYS